MWGAWHCLLSLIQPGAPVTRGPGCRRVAGPQQRPSPPGDVKMLLLGTSTVEREAWPEGPGKAPGLRGLGLLWLLVWTGRKPPLQRSWEFSSARSPQAEGKPLGESVWGPPAPTMGPLSLG